MKFYSAKTRELWPRDLQDAMQEEYKNAHAVGVVRTGENNLFFRAGLKYYAVPFAEIQGLFRRVNRVPAKMCCGSGEFEVESLVVVSGGTEIAQVQLPGTKAARALMAELKEKLPEVDFSAPARKEAAV